MNDREPEKNFEKLIHERLRALPDLPAPQELIPAVLAKINAAQETVWWRRPWLEWPRAARLASAVLMTTVIGGAWFFRSQISEATLNATGFLKPLQTLTGALLSARRAFVDSIGSQFVIVSTAVLVVLYLSVVGLGVLCYRIAADRRLNV